MFTCDRKYDIIDKLDNALICKKLRSRRINMAKTKKKTKPAVPDNALHLKEMSDGSVLVTKGGFFYRHIFVILSFIIPFVLMYTAFAVFSCQPFGNNDKQILVTDLWHQYFPFLVDFQDKLKHCDSLLWSWTQGGGTNYLSLASYYLASPFNLLLVFVPSTVEAVNIFLTFSVAFKIGLAGLFCAFFLRYAFKRCDISITIFSVCFAFSAHFMGYYWCDIWLDTVALTPLVALGFLALMREGKYRVYIIALAVSVFANYYIGLFTCVFMVLCFIGYTIVKWDGWRNFGKRLARISICSVVAVMLTAILILPAFFGLQTTHAADSTFPEIYSINANESGNYPSLEGTVRMVQLTVGNTLAFIEPSTVRGFPNIACGVVPIIFFMVFLASGKIKTKEKLFSVFLLIFFMLSFIIRQLDYMWHGFHFTNMIPYRFSYLFSFVVIVASYKAFTLIKEINLYDLGITWLLTPLFFLITAKITDGEQGLQIENFDIWIKSVIIGVIVMALFTAYVLINNLSKSTIEKLSKNNGDVYEAEIEKQRVTLTKTVKLSKIVLCGLLLSLVIIESGVTAFMGVETTKVTTVNDYPRGGENTENVVNYMKELEAETPELWRAEFTSTQTLCDSSLNRFNGISMFNSMTNEKISRFAENFGLMGWLSGNRYTYAENSPVTDLFLNLKYIISRDGNFNNDEYLSEVYSSGNVKLLKNKSYIPMGFMTSEKLLEYNGEDEEDSYNPFDKQNEFFKLATGVDEDVYTPLDVVSQGHTDYNHFNVNRSAYGKYNFTDVVNDGTALKLKWNFTAPEDGLYFAYVQLRNTQDTTDLQNVTALQNDVNRPGTSSFYIKRPYIMSIGEYKKGDKISLQANPKAGASGNATIYVNKFNKEVFEKGLTIVSQNVMTTTKLTGNEMEGEIYAGKDGLFYTSVPFEDGQTDDDTLIGKLFGSKSEGWTAYVDGEEVEITPIANALVAFKLPKGNHKIKLLYYPKGFKKGALLTFLGLAMFVGYTVFLFLRKRKAKNGTYGKPEKKAVKTEDENVTVKVD